MKQLMRLTALLAAVFIFVACEHENEVMPNRSKITYWVTNTTAPAASTIIEVGTDTELDLLLDRFCDYAEGGHAVTFYGNTSHNTATKSDLANKEASTYSTTSREEMKRWMARMEEAGLTVTVTYDHTTGTYNGYAYSVVPQLQPEEGPKPSRITYSNSYDAGTEGEDEHAVCTFTWDGERLTTVDMVEFSWHKYSDGSTGDTSVLHSIAHLSYDNNICSSINIYDTSGNMLERCEYTYIGGRLTLEWRWSSSTTKTYIYNNEGYVYEVQNTTIRDNNMETVPNRYRYGWENDNVKYFYEYGNGRIYQTAEYDNTLRPRGIIFGSLTFMPGNYQYIHPQVLWSKNNIRQLDWYVGHPSPRVINYTYTDGKPTSAVMRYEVGTASWTYEYL